MHKQELNFIKMTPCLFSYSVYSFGQVGDMYGKIPLLGHASEDVSFALQP